MMKDSCYASFRDDAITELDIKVGVVIAIEFDRGQLSMIRVNWGPEEGWECPFDGAVEQHWLFSKEETKKLMQLTRSSNGRELVNAVYDRFKNNAHEADHDIIKWCQEEKVEYFFFYYRQITEKTKRKLAVMRHRQSENSKNFK